MGADAGLFDRQAVSYAEYRPSYPEDLYRDILKFCNFASKPKIALDIATGNGQAAVELANHFEKVIGSSADFRVLTLYELSVPTSLMECSRKLKLAWSLEFVRRRSLPAQSDSLLKECMESKQST